MPPLHLRSPLCLRTLLLRRQVRPFSTPPPDPSRTRLSRLHSRIPRFLSSYTTPLLNAPITHITSFLILHELTAIIPLFTLAATFHYTGWLPPFLAEGKWVSDGVEKFGRYFRRKGWFGPEGAVDGKLGEDGREIAKGKRLKWWARGEEGVKVVVEFATAYAVTKALLPVRLVGSVWATPWFARVVVVPVARGVGRLFGRGGGVKKGVVGPGTGASGAAGTGAVGGGGMASGAVRTSPVGGGAVKKLPGE